jgi:hypothetical protein
MILNILLDIDGVLCTSRATKNWETVALPYGAYKHTHIEWDEAAVTQFLIFLTELDDLGIKHQIILSSDWRFMNPEESTRNLFRRYSIPQYVDITPIHNRDNHGLRGKEILDWLTINNHLGNPYLVIDDEQFGIKPTIPKEHTVFVEGGWHSKGFGKYHRKHALAKVKKQLLVTKCICCGGKSSTTKCEDCDKYCIEKCNIHKVQAIR